MSRTRSNRQTVLGKKWNVKGKIFESSLRTLLLKSGFSSNIHTNQLTKNQQRLHGRGATYDPDVLGQFTMGIPFVNPILIIGEAKYYHGQVNLGEVRKFLGSYVDFSQYQRVNTKASGDQRYSVLFEPKFTYCPIFFSAKGFQKSAEGLMFAHGINYVSYENSDIIAKIFVIIEDILNYITFASLDQHDYKYFLDLNLLLETNLGFKKRNFNDRLQRLITYIDRINSIIGVLDFNYPIHILYEKNVTASTGKEVRIIRLSENKFILENISKRKYGEFSLSEEFIKTYIKLAFKKHREDRIFKQIDIIYKHDNTWQMKQLIIQETARQELFRMYQPTASNQTNTS